VEAIRPAGAGYVNDMTLFAGIIALLALAVTALFLPLLWIVVGVLLIALILYAIGMRSRSKLEDGPTV
jgi:4-hydroxybenzoate polyprenyltransferase